MRRTAEGPPEAKDPRRRSAGESLRSIALETWLVLAALLALVLLGWSTGAPILEPIRRSRLTFSLLLLTPVLLFLLLKAQGARGLRPFLRDWLPIYGALAVYESLKHMHAIRISEWLGIAPKDALMLRIDEAIFGKALPLWFDGWVPQWAIETLHFAYVWVYYLGPAVALGWAYLGRREDRQKTLFRRLRRGLTVTLLGGYVSYILVPVAGPKVFIPDQFQQAIDTQSILIRYVFDALRYGWDCFPSLHTAVPWMMTLLLWGSIRRWARIACVTASVLVTISTFVLRYHYGIDVVAGLVWAAIVAVVVSRQLPVTSPRAGPPRAAGGLRRRLWLLGVLFTVTGFTGLVQEQSFEKLLGTLVGTSTPAAAIVLATYFAGLTLGAWAYARFLRSRVDRPLRVYALLEAGAALWAVALFLFFDRLIPPFVPLLRGGFEAGPLELGMARLAVAAAWILPPTLLMGATLPAVADVLAGFRSRSSGRLLALFYSLNLLGAIAGAVLGPYLLFAKLGLDRTLLLAAILGGGVAVAAWWSDRRRALRPRPAGRVESASAAATAPVNRSLPAGVRLLLVTAFLGGFGFFALEVLWVQLISVVFGNSIYSFATMLAAVLAGLFLGGQLVAAAFPQRRALSPLAPGLLLLASTLPLGLAHDVWPKVPHLLATLGGGLTSFASGEALKFVFAAVLLVPASTLLGAVFPVLFRVELEAKAERSAWVGYLSAWNAMGCVLGALFATFLLLPRLGSEVSDLLIVSTYAVLGVLLIFAARPAPRVRLLSLLFALACVGFISTRGAWNPLELTSGENVYFRTHQVWPESKLLLFHEDAYGGITTVVETPPRKGGYGRAYRTLLTNGKFQGNDAWEAEAQVGFALIPILQTRQQRSALVIGYGTGHSAEVVRAMGFDETVVAEIAPGILAGAELFQHLNGDVLSDPRTRLALEDGRNLMLLDPRRYDLITMEISSVWFAGATNLYSREFYELARARLETGGIFQQWLQLHHLDTREVAIALATVRAVFPEVSFWVFGGQGVIVASNEPQELQATPLARLVDNALRLGFEPDSLPKRFQSLLSSRLLSPADVTRMCAEMRQFDSTGTYFALNTDRNRRFEYSTPRFYLSPLPHREINVRGLSRFATFPPFEVSRAGDTPVPEALRGVLREWSPAWPQAALGLPARLPSP